MFNNDIYDDFHKYATDGNKVTQNKSNACLVHTSRCSWLYSKIQFIFVLYQPSIEEDMTSNYWKFHRHKTCRNPMPTDYQAKFWISLVSS